MSCRDAWSLGDESSPGASIPALPPMSSAMCLQPPPGAGAWQGPRTGASLDGIRPAGLIRSASLAASKLRGRASGALTARLPAVSLERVRGASVLQSCLPAVSLEGKARASVLQSHCLDEVAPVAALAPPEEPPAGQSKVETTMGMLWYVLAVLIVVYILQWIGL